MVSLMNLRLLSVFVMLIGARELAEVRLTELWSCVRVREVTYSEEWPL